MRLALVDGEIVHEVLALGDPACGQRRGDDLLLTFEWPKGGDVRHIDFREHFW